jgi:hypothetical protein
MPRGITRDISVRAKEAATWAYHKVYETMSPQVLDESALLGRDLDAYNPDQTAVLAWAETSADYMRIKRSALRRVYDERRVDLMRRKNEITVRDFIGLLIAAKELSGKV